jgi:hypothetical protein
MNKKLFFAGFALLAAVSFTSCSTDTPIDITNPNGVAPDGSHAIGGAYDWTVTPKNVKQLDSLWNVDKKTVQANIANEKIASICINVDNFTLESGKSIDIPALWANANGKIVKVYVSGNFKNPDYLRADAIKNAATPAKQKKFPVLIDTKNVAGSEVQFTFDGEAFDLELTTDKARSLINGAYEIGYFKAIAAEGMSATEVQSGLVDAIDYASTGDVKEKEDAVIAGLWVRDLAILVNVEAEKGIPVGTNKYIYAKDLYVEESCTINNLSYNKDAKKTFKLGTIEFVNPANTVVWFNKDKIYADEIVGAKAANNRVIRAGATTIDLNYIDNVENVTINNDATLTKDVFSGVIFFGAVTFNTGDITSFADVTFNGLNIEINADDVTVNFDKVNFLTAPALTSTLEYTYTEAGYTSKTYQWIISDADPTLGYYQQCKNDLSDLKEYNKGKESKTYTTEDVQWDGVNNFMAGTKNDKSAEAKTFAIVVIKTPYAAGTYPITPEGTLIDMTSTCKFNGKTDDDNLNQIWGFVMFKDEGAWYNVKYADTLYRWRKLDSSYAYNTYVLVK